MTSFVAAGAALAALGIAGRYLTRLGSAVRYYKGGFEPNMTRREASLILGVSPNTNIDTIKQSHKRIMLLNHPDRGGSPYLATKINEAKGILEQNK